MTPKKDNPVKKVVKVVKKAKEAVKKGDVRVRREGGKNDGWGR